jgi:hypothetical protein
VRGSWDFDLQMDGGRVLSVDADSWGCLAAGVYVQAARGKNPLSKIARARFDAREDCRIERADARR